MTAATAPRPGPMIEASYRREILPWTLLGLTLGLVEGATAAVLIKHRFAGTAPGPAVNLAVALVSGAPALSNVVSFIWANIAHGRSRVRLLAGLQAVFALLVGFVGLAPHQSGGLVFAVGSILGARMLWAGILTIRAAVWTANYPRHLAARMTGRIVVFSSLAIAGAAALAAFALESHRIDPRWLYAGAALAGLVAAVRFRAMRVRREYQLLAAEAAAGASEDAFSLRALGDILRHDPAFRAYMFWMGLYGGGQLMLTSQMVVVLTDQLQIAPGLQIVLLSIIPLVTLPFFVAAWARLFDGQHVVLYRSRQGWVLVAAVLMNVAGALAASVPLLLVGAVLVGIANAGASIGWNLGHNDFASLGRAQQYMGVHVTLTGVRGMIAPPLGMAVYEALEAAQPGAGRWSLVLPLLLTAAGAAGFTSMRWRFAREEEQAEHR
ncbi:MAG: hypothetical protein WCE48_00785 [Steroidobacteraceae bacterium]